MNVRVPVVLALLACVGLRFAVAAAPLDRFGGNTAIKGRPTGWFHVEQLAGRWFFVTPEGNAFFSLGVTHADDARRQDERDVFRTRHAGSEARLAEFLVGRLRDWGYNTAGYGALPSMERAVPYLAAIWTEGPRSHSAGVKSHFSDIFDPVVQERLRTTIRTAAGRHADNPFCLGYVFIDLPVWNLQPAGGPGYLEFLRALPETAPGRRALAGFLRDHPGADDEVLQNHIAETYYTCAVGELRRADPHHLILGDRFMAATPAQKNLRTPDSILRTAARFVDALAFQPMGTPQPIRDYLDHVHRLTGKPVLLADTNTMKTRPAKDLADTTEYERIAGEHTLTYYLDAAASPACLGIHRCTFRDYQPWNTQFHRRGLLKADDSPYPLLTEYTRRTNDQVLRLVYAQNR